MKNWLPANAAAYNAAVEQRKRAVQDYVDAIEVGRDAHMAYLRLQARFDEINRNLGRPVDGTVEIF
jgi:hypothetical protein